MRRNWIFFFVMAAASCDKPSYSVDEEEDTSRLTDKQNENETATFDPSENISEDTQTPASEDANDEDDRTNSGDNSPLDTDELDSDDADTSEITTPDTSVTLTCPDGATTHHTASGRIVCCSADHPVFCDENAADYHGGCFGEAVDCDTLTLCGGSWLACTDGSLPYCDDNGDMTCHPCPEDAVRHETKSGRPFCCTDERPLFCDETETGYPGGCWTNQIDCSTIIPCGNYFSACPAGMVSNCVDGGIECDIPQQEG